MAINLSSIVPAAAPGGGGGMTSLVKSENYTASAGEIVMVESDKGTYTITLPATPSGGERVSVWDCGDNAGSNTITVGRNGETINGVAEDFLLNMDGGRADFTFDATNDTWEYSFVIQTVQPSQAVNISQTDLIPADNFQNRYSCTRSTSHTHAKWNMPNSPQGSLAGFWRVPDDWDGQDIQVSILWSPGDAGTGDTDLSMLTVGHAPGETLGTSGTWTYFTTAANGTQDELIETDLKTIPAATLSAGDLVSLIPIRESTDAYGGTVQFHGVHVYFGRSITLKAATAISNTASAVWNKQTGTTYTLQETDNGKIVSFSNAAAIAVTLPDGLSEGFQCTILQTGAGVPTVTRSGSDTVNGAATGIAPAAQWDALYLSKFSSTEWVAIG